MASMLIRRWSSVTPLRPRWAGPTKILFRIVGAMAIVERARVIPTPVVGQGSANLFDL